MFESYSPLRVEQKKLQDRLAALERLTHERTALQATKKPKGELSKGMPLWKKKKPRAKGERMMCDLFITYK